MKKKILFVLLIVLALAFCVFGTVGSVYFYKSLVNSPSFSFEYLLGLIGCLAGVFAGLAIAFKVFVLIISKK